MTVAPSDEVKTPLCCTNLPSSSLLQTQLLGRCRDGSPWAFLNEIGRRLWRYPCSFRGHVDCAIIEIDGQHNNAGHEEEPQSHRIQRDDAPI